MKNSSKYTRQFFPAPSGEMEWARKNYIDKAPIWCSVDLRDGNQALTVPMSLDEKLDFFKMLLSIGFKEIEVGFPAASDTEFNFIRKLIDDNLIPDDVTIQVLTQSREHIIKKTFECIRGAKNAIVHLYNPTSFIQREQVFKKSKEEIIEIATEGAALINECAKDFSGNIRFEYSPESFSATEPDFALEISNAVLDIWKPSPDRKAIINLPVTVEVSMPHVYANQVEYMCKNLKYRDSVIISLHPHNDRGCAVADCEMGLLAGAERIEGTLFGNGERTGNADIVTVAMNLYAQGIEPGLDFSDMPEICELYEGVTKMNIHERSPYSGKLVFAAFSGSHQDAIAKSLSFHEQNALETWSVPYLPIDPKDIGREYETDVIRINSQSGKGGIGYLLEHHYGFVIPRRMREAVGYAVKHASDLGHKELSIQEVYRVFCEKFVNINTPIELIDYEFVRTPDIFANVTIKVNGTPRLITASGNGRLDAVSNAIKHCLGINFSNLTYSEHSLSEGSSSQAVCYVSITIDGQIRWGVGIHNDIIAASINALFSAINSKVTLL